MNISFPDSYAINPDDPFSIVYLIDVDGTIIQCIVESEALDDIDPDNRLDTAEKKFTTNRFSFEELAEDKINNNQIISGKVTIIGKDVQ